MDQECVSPRSNFLHRDPTEESTCGFKVVQYGKISQAGLVSVLLWNFYVALVERFWSCSEQVRVGGETSTLYTTLLYSCTPPPP